jgi:predicted phosphodiesterase
MMTNCAAPLRTAVMADIHGNTPAFQAVLADIQRYDCRQVFFLGDLVNGVDPAGCVRLLREFSARANGETHCLKGNAEAYLLTPDLDDFPAPLEPWHEDMVRLVRWFETRLSPSDLDWIRSFPDYLRWQDAIMVHDSPVDRLSPQRWHIPDRPVQYQEWLYHSPGIQADMPVARWQELIDCMDHWDLRQVFCAHTHAPFARHFGPRLVCNAGSVGAPLGGDPRPSWILIDEKGTIEIKRVDYDITSIHWLVDQTPDYPGFSRPGFQAAYKKWFTTGVHWREHLDSQEG